MVLEEKHVFWDFIKAFNIGRADNLHVLQSEEIYVIT